MVLVFSLVESKNIRALPADESDLYTEVYAAEESFVI